MTTAVPTDLRQRRGQAVVVNDALVDLLAEQAPLTVVRGPRGYGKTTLLDTWLQSRRPTGQVVRLALTPQCRDVERFWFLLEEALTGDGSTEPGTSRSRALAHLARRTAPLTVVIDDFHRAGSAPGAEPDEDLVELVRRNDQVSLVVATRTVRPIETTGSLSVDLVLLCPEKLRMRPDQVRQLAALLGADLGAGEADRLVEGFGGWPAVIRSVLTRLGTTGGTVTPEVADDYLGSVWNDLRDPALQEFVLRTAVPETFDAELAEALVRGAALHVLREVRASGLLREELRNGRHVFSYPPLMREALVRLFAENQPDELRRTHTIVMDRALRGGDVVAALRHAVAAGDLASVERVLREYWDDLVTAHRDALVEVIRTMPAGDAARCPRARVVVEEVARAPVDARALELRWPAGDLRGITAELAPERAGTDETTYALMQWGVAALLTGDFPTAHYAFGRARTRSQQDPYGAPLAALATLAIVGTHAVAGDLDLASAWLDDPSLRPDGRLPGDESLHAWERLVTAMIAVDRLAPEAAAAVGAMGERARRDEMWACTVLLEASHAAVSGGAVEATRWAARLRAARHYLPRGRFAEMSLQAAEVDVLLAGGLDEQARYVARTLPRNTLTFDTHAHVAFRVGNHREAVLTARDALRQPGLSRRASMRLRLVLAGAHDALGEPAAAVAAFTEAIRVAQASGQRRPLLVLDHGTFVALAAGDRATLALWPQHHRPVRERPRTALGTLLTPREQEVLRALRHHSGPVPVAEAMGVSVNTVKSHLRSVYAKLGVTNRTAALGRAAELDGAAAPTGDPEG
ncbi:helix-turn-helix transcriptional regulator [Georgenia alba]|uniref:LuxR C-terminal-related transcriptional regulator n=1 Tax=Georgenia alba TaxID=2233858 RepID=A0ABW2QH71_9MICO